MVPPTIADLIVELISVITNASVFPFLGFAIVVGAAGQLWQRVARSAK